MKNLAVAFVLFFAIQHLLIAQNGVAKKKPLTVKDLNTLETGKIKSISIPGKPITNDTSVNIQPAVITKNVSVIKNDTLQVSKDPVRDTVILDIPPVILISLNLTETAEQKNIQPPKLSKADSFVLAKYYTNQYIADSIRNAHKNWLDSTLKALPAKKPVVIGKDDEIEIFITGGGLYTGVNPTIYNRLTIYNSGLVHREIKTKLQGERVENKKISKDVLRKLEQYIIDLGFFDFNNLYDCEAKDKACNTRLKTNPEPTPLSIVVSVGVRRKKIYVALYAPHMESNWVNFPANLEKIVNAIYDVAGR